MNKKEKLKLLKAVEQLIYMCAEYTPPDVKSSELNMYVTRAALSVDEVIKLIKKYPLK